jgi:hypothetical protein
MAMPIELKPCPRCGREPEREMITIHLPTFAEYTIKRRYICRRCRIAGKFFRDIADAEEAWNRMVDDGK